MFLDVLFIGTIECHGHGTTSTKGVAANIVAGEAIALQTKVDNSIFDGGVDVLGIDLLGIEGLPEEGAEGGGSVGGVLHDVCNPAC